MSLGSLMRCWRGGGCGMGGVVCGVPGSVVGTVAVVAVGGEDCGAGAGGVGPGPGGVGVGPGVGPGGVGGVGCAEVKPLETKIIATAEARTALRIAAFMDAPEVRGRARVCPK